MDKTYCSSPRKDVDLQTIHLTASLIGNRFIHRFVEMLTFIIQMVDKSAFHCFVTIRIITLSTVMIIVMTILMTMMWIDGAGRPSG